MDKIVNIHHAKTHLSRLIEQVEGGEEVVIARAGRPVARLVPVSKARKSRPDREPGFLKGKIRIGRDFDEPLPDSVLKALRGYGR